MEVIKKNLSEMRKISRNVRKHPEKQIQEYIRSINMFGQIKPIVVDETGEIIAGNGLYEALCRMGAETADVVVMSNLTPTQKKKLMLADNRVYELGLTDTNEFDAIIKELGGDLDVPGWDEELLTLLVADTSEIDDAVADYGTFEPQAIERVQSREVLDHAEVRGVAPTYQPPVNSDNDTAEDMPITPTGRHVICPHCGEKIWL